MSDEDIIRIANHAGWDVQNLDDGFGERLRRFAQDLERQPLYTTPAKQWVGLTDEEIAQGLKESWVTEQAWQSAVWWAEAKLKEKNT
jgi:hypothetical protein